MVNSGYVSRKVFEEHLRLFPIPTFDLLVQLPGRDEGIVLVRRRIAPYAGKWALPGLRMLKGETIDDTLQRIAQQELSISIDTEKKRFVGQYVGTFSTEQARQDISTGYLIRSNEMEEITPNPDHFSGLRIVRNLAELPRNTGAMYKHYLQQVLPESS